jgi:hypothetical protein
MIGYFLIGLSVLVLMAVLYGQNRRREEFTNMKGNFPDWGTIVSQVRFMMDKAYDYDVGAVQKMDQADAFEEAVSKITKNATDPIIVALSPPTADEITAFMDPSGSYGKYLAKGVTLNVDAPFDTKMAMFAAADALYRDAMKSPTATVKKTGEIPYDRAVVLYYQNIASATLLKNIMMHVAFNNGMAVGRGKAKPSGISSILPR